MCGVDSHDGSLDECVLQEINGTLVFTQDKSEQHASSMVTGNHLEKVHVPGASNKLLVVASEQGYSACIWCVF